MTPQADTNPKPILLIALGGNAMIQKGQRGTIREQFDNLRIPIRQIAKLSTRYRIIITHGNGPQVGHLMLQQEACRDAPALPLEILVAQTEGQIGYMIESTLDEALMDIGIQFRPLVTLITYVVVDRTTPLSKIPPSPSDRASPRTPPAGCHTRPSRHPRVIAGWSPRRGRLRLLKSVRSKSCWK